MIIRVFQVTINSELRNDFERDFKSISVHTIENCKGLVSCDIAGPSKWNPDDYLMISKWKDESSLIEFVGENWNKAVIPDDMKKYAKCFTVSHYNEL